MISKELDGIKDRSFDNAHDLMEQTANINHALGRGFANIRRAGEAGDIKLHPHDIYTEGVTESHLAYEDILEGNAKQLKRTVESQADIRSELKLKYRIADVRAELFLNANPRLREDPYQTNLVRAASRFDAFDLQPLCLFDLDHTSNVDNAEFYGKVTPGTPFAEPQMAEYGRGVFLNVFARAWGPTLDQFEQTYQSAGKAFVKKGNLWVRPDADEIEARPGGEEDGKFLLRPGINQLQAQLIEEGSRLGILSAGLDPRAKAMASQLDMRDFFEIFQTITKDNVNSNNKALGIQDIAFKNFNRLVAFWGDGGSDQSITEKEPSEIVGCCFALKGGSFEAKLQEAGMLYFSYTNHFDSLHTWGDIANMRVTMRGFMPKDNK